MFYEFQKLYLQSTEQNQYYTYDNFCVTNILNVLCLMFKIIAFFYKRAVHLLGLTFY